MKINVIKFPGSNCDHDAFHISKIRGHQVDFVWHKDKQLKDPDLIIIPGGFSYGDYLRCGAIAKFSPVIGEVIKFAQKGGLVMGICNGFQILTEIGLLPGALMMNESLKFICQHQYITSVNQDSVFTKGLRAGKPLDIPIAHKEGNYFIDNAGLKNLQDKDLIAFKYCNEKGEITRESNPNGAIANIAVMPHPERAAENKVLSQDGSEIFASIEKFFA